MRVLDREGMGGTLTLGENVCADEVEIDTSADVTLEDGVCLSDGVVIYTHDHAPEDITRKHASPLVIRSGAWLGARVTVLESCREIGEGAVIGACACVTKDVPAYEVWVGIPARKLRDIERTR